MKAHKIEQAPIPMRKVGPVKIIGPEVNDELWLPLATYESPLWPSVGRGARVTKLAGGIHCTVVDERMSRSIVVQADNAATLHAIWLQIRDQLERINRDVVSKTSRFARLIDMHPQFVGNLLYLRLEYITGDASGHNMVTLASEHVQSWLLTEFSQLKYVSISANYCTDKKVSAVNGILGRGKNVVAEVTIERELVARRLKSTPEKIVDLHIKKNLIGSNLAGGLRSANAHAANMLLAFYLATGQDAANIVEGSQCMVHCEVVNGDLYFSVSLPNLIVGSVGNGKGIDFVERNLAELGCKDDREPGANARRLAVICACSVLCGELSLMAAQTNPGELMQSHVNMERG